jgi:hypothetical protein
MMMRRVLLLVYAFMLQPRLQNPEKPYDPYRVNCRIIPSYWDFERHHQQSEAF